MNGHHDYAARLRRLLWRPPRAHGEQPASAWSARWNCSTTWSWWRWWPRPLRCATPARRTNHL